jgi:hypothetical protein
MQQTERQDNTGRLERFEDLAVWRRAHELTLDSSWTVSSRFFSCTKETS